MPGTEAQGILDVSGYTGFGLALATGFFGSAFFMLAQMQGNLSKAKDVDMQALWSWSIIVLRCLVGIGAASILYFVFRSGLLQGTLWPDLGGMGFEELISPLNDDGKKSWIVASKLLVPTLDTGLLVFWSFLAGYSQTLVPKILTSMESRGIDTL